MRRFAQIDVFTDTPYRGNPVAVVLDGEGLSPDEMQAFARWTNLSETTFVLPPSDAEANYRVRIFTPVAELPFAGHPTLGTCHAWLEAGGGPQQDETVVQECSAGLVVVRRTAAELAFAAPPLIRSGPVEEELVRRIASAVGLGRCAQAAPPSPTSRAREQRLDEPGGCTCQPTPRARSGWAAARSPASPARS